MGSSRSKMEKTCLSEHEQHTKGCLRCLRLHHHTFSKRQYLCVTSHKSVCFFANIDKVVSNMVSCTKIWAIWAALQRNRREIDLESF